MIDVQKDTKEPEKHRQRLELFETLTQLLFSFYREVVIRSPRV